VDHVRRSAVSGSPTAGGRDDRRRQRMADLPARELPIGSPVFRTRRGAAPDRRDEDRRYRLHPHSGRAGQVHRDTRPDGVALRPLPDRVDRAGCGSVGIAARSGSVVVHRGQPVSAPGRDAGDDMTTLTRSPDRPAAPARSAERVRAQRVSRAWQVLQYVLLTAWTLLSLFPFYVTVATSLKLKRDVINPNSWLFAPTLDNYTAVFTERNIGHYLGNSAIIAVCSVVPSLVLALFGAYGLTRFGLVKERSIATSL